MCKKKKKKKTWKLSLNFSANKRKVILVLLKLTRTFSRQAICNYSSMRAFFSLVEVKMKKRNWLACENDTRLALSATNFEFPGWSPKTEQKSPLCKNVS